LTADVTLTDLVIARRSASRPLARQYLIPAFVVVTIVVVMVPSFYIDQKSSLAGLPLPIEDLGKRPIFSWGWLFIILESHPQSRLERISSSGNL
jgi:hypothetical protein